MANRPEKTFRAGACSASVFINDRKTADGVIQLPSVSFACRYRDDATGEWKDTSSMSPNQVARAMAVLRQALDYCWLELESQRRQQPKE